jgi:hypothetical protein
LKEAKAISVEIYGDSELVIKQLNDQYECRNDILRNYYEECKGILKSFQLVILQHIPSEHNEEANRLAQSASGYRENQEVFANDICSFGSKVENGRDKSRTVPYRSRVSSRPFSYLRENTGAGAGWDVPGAGAKTGEASSRPYLRYPVLGRDNTGFIPFSIQPG